MFLCVWSGTHIIRAGWGSVIMAHIANTRLTVALNTTTLAATWQVLVWLALARNSLRSCSAHVCTTNKKQPVLCPQLSLHSMVGVHVSSLCECGCVC